ncbi:MAG: fluoride efflux transporter CrcB [Acidimicrobiales bacterium]|nr:MAG: fluoride efflux transporter CrcB [Acidimicrobiales bacterium]
MTALLVALGACLGASLRYTLDHVVHIRLRSRFPWAIFAVNVIGSLILGGLIAAAESLPKGVAALLGAGLCGGLTTYSTFAHQTIRLAEQGRRGLAVLYAASSVLSGLTAAALGYWASFTLWG